MESCSQDLRWPKKGRFFKNPKQDVPAEKLVVLRGLKVVAETKGLRSVINAHKVPTTAP